MTNLSKINMPACETSFLTPANDVIYYTTTLEALAFYVVIMAAVSVMIVAAGYVLTEVFF